MQRLLRTKKDVIENKEKIDAHVYKILAAFARGVNEYIRTHRGTIPDWIDGVTAEDIEALEHSNYMRFYSIHDALQKLQKTDEKLYKFREFGSNQWAILPSRSANGRVIHVEHTHMPWANRFQNYEAHLLTPGTLNAAGISWFGSPFFGSPEYDWTKPVPGWVKETEWGPYLPFEPYPQLLNPPTAFLQNCNNPPWLATKDSGLKPLSPAPYYLSVTLKANAGEEALNARGERLFQVLGQNAKFTLEDMKALAFDTYVMPADVIVPLLENAYSEDALGRGVRQDLRVKRALELIAVWDRRSSEDSVAYTYIYFWGRAYRDLFFRELVLAVLEYSRKRINIYSHEEQELARRAFEEGIDQITKRFGKTEVRWGEVNVVVRGGKFPVGGTGLYDVLHPDKGPEQKNGQIYTNDGWGH